MPVIGAVPGWPGYFVAGGTYAFTFAPLWARCLAALIEGRDPPVSLDGLGPGRLVPSASTCEYPEERSTGT
jgi:sarcosine oxidase subunit beta